MTSYVWHLSTPLHGFQHGLGAVLVYILLALKGTHVLEAVLGSLAIGDPFVHEGYAKGLLLTHGGKLFLDREYSVSELVYFTHPARLAPVRPGDMVFGVSP
jgi:hypothetical protein